MTSATMISAALTGITDCATLIGIQGRLTSVSVARIGVIQTPTPPRSAKKATTRICAAMLTARRAGQGMRSTSSGQPIWDRLTEASAEP